jgi:hypothetical protein
MNYRIYQRSVDETVIDVSLCNPWFTRLVYAATITTVLVLGLASVFLRGGFGIQLNQQFIVYQ